MSRGKDNTIAPKSEPRVIEVPPITTVRELAESMGASPIDVIKQLMASGIMANINQQIDFDTAAIIGSEMGFEIVPLSESEEMVVLAENGVPIRDRFIANEAECDLEERPPVITVLGHVDHGKTTLLDAIRETNVVDAEAGGITQHIGAYQVEVAGRKVTFLDTPGHEAFTAMRARGTQCTDLVILVVAADDGVMPQTREAIDHARAAQVPIMVALNKIDKANANPDKVKQELADAGLLVEEWGGEIICVPLSARQREGIDDLLENIFLVTEVAELRANPCRLAQGSVIEGAMDEKQGVTVTLLVQNGTLKVGDIVVIGEDYGKVRAMFDDHGKRIKEALPSTPIAILGLSTVPDAGIMFEAVDTERAARDIVNRRAEARRLSSKQALRTISLEDIFQRMQAGETKELNVIVKADVQGSIEPIVKSLQDLGAKDLKVNILRQATGNISESDVTLALASAAIVIGFDVGIDPAAQRMADTEGVDVRLYKVIYKLIDDVDKALKGLLEPTFKEVVIGHAEVRAVFRIPRRGNIAGSYVLDGRVQRNATARVIRADKILFEGKVHSLKRFTEDVQEVATGYECGISIDGFNDFKEGDIVEFFRMERES
jgi:translation initiation factor IF-2